MNRDLLVGVLILGVGFILQPNLQDLPKLCHHVLFDGVKNLIRCLKPYAQKRELRHYLAGLLGLQRTIAKI